MKEITNPELKHHELTERIIGAYFDVYDELGPGFLESVYEQSFAIALVEAGLKVQRQVPVDVWFRSRRVGVFRADMLVESVVMLELKVAAALDHVHRAQLMHYLKATDIEVGLLFNFGAKAEFRRVVFDNSRKKIGVNPRDPRSPRLSDAP